MSKNKKPKPADAGRLVRKAADVLEDRIWYKGGLSTLPKDFWTNVDFVDNVSKQSNLAMCAAGVINFTFCGNPILDRDRVKRIPLLRLTYSMLDDFLGEMIEPWNDGPSTSKEEVVQTLRKFADEYDPQKV